MAIFYNVAPRYTCGSPALVRASIAEQVAKEETHAYQRSLEGVYGEEQKTKAERLGLSGIVEIHDVRYHHVDVTDWITGSKSRIRRGQREPR